MSQEHAGQAVDQLQALQDADQRHEQDDAGQHVGEHHRGVQRAPPRKPNARERVRAEQCAQGGKERHRGRHSQAVPEGLDEDGLATEESGVERNRRVGRKQLRTRQQIEPAFQGADDDHQQEGQHQHRHHDQGQQPRDDPRPQVQANAIEPATQQAEPDDHPRQPQPEHPAGVVAELESFGHGQQHHDGRAGARLHATGSRHQPVAS